MICNVYRMPVNRGQSQQQGLKIEKKEEMSKGHRSVLPVNFPDMFTSVFVMLSVLSRPFLSQKALLK